jgi:gliding motility-associated lipoprotein GldH
MIRYSYGKLAGLIIGLFLFSCQPGQVYKEHVKFSDHQWAQTNQVTFAPVIEDTSVSYTTYFDFRHVYGYQFETVQIKVERVTPSGAQEQKEYTIQVAKDGKGYKSDCSGDICDLRHALEDFSYPEAGEYKFTISHTMPYEDLPNVMEVGLVVRKD